MSRILIIEDETVIRRAVKRLLERHGYLVAEAASIEEAEAQHTPNSFDLIISDVRLPGMPGTEIIQRAAPVPVLIMTSYASIRSAVEAMKMGAIDYISKPFDHDELLMLVDRTIKQDRNQRQQAVLKDEVEKSYPVKGMVGECAEMQEVFKRIDKVAPTDATVLILENRVQARSWPPGPCMRRVYADNPPSLFLIALPYRITRLSRNSLVSPAKGNSEQVAYSLKPMGGPFFSTRSASSPSQPRPAFYGCYRAMNMAPVTTQCCNPISVSSPPPTGTFDNWCSSRDFAAISTSG
jgi:CheY-like chemotaxis protein